MYTRKVFCAILSMFLFLGLFSPATVQSAPTDAALSNQQAIAKPKFKIPLTAFLNTGLH